MKIVKITISRNFRMSKDVKLPHDLLSLIPQRTGRQAVIAAVRNLMQPYVDGSFECKGKTCKVLVALSKDNNTITVSVQERGKHDVNYTEHVCEIKIKAIDGTYEFKTNDQSDHAFVIAALHPEYKHRHYLREYGENHIFESDIRSALQKLMNTCAIRIFRGAFLFDNTSDEYKKLTNHYIPLVSGAVQNGSIQFRSIGLQNDKENRKEVSTAIADNINEELESICSRMEMPGPNYKRIERDLADVETKAHMADDMINRDEAHIIYGMTNVMFNKAYKGIEGLYAEREALRLQRIEVSGIGEK